MSHPADFHDAHLRHWQDAELLFRHDRWANADQLYGLSAECGLKAVMRLLEMPVGQHGVPTKREHRAHMPQLWAEFTAFVRGRGRSTTAAVLAWHLARNGEHVLVVDLDLESPGLSSAMLDLAARPEFGVTDWFVEDLVGQDDYVSERMAAAPAWAQELDGDVRVVPAHGSEPGEYLAKLGRVYLDIKVPWTVRLERLLSRLEETYKPSIVLLESRSGLHDIAAATVTDLGAQVLLFAVDAESHWTDYAVLFRHWQTHGLAPSIRERLSIVSALTPEIDTERYLRRFREQAWNLFRERLYDDIEPSGDSRDRFSFDLHEEGAPHDPIAIHWNRGLAAGASLRDLEWEQMRQAYTKFLTRFDEIVAGSRDEGHRP